MIYTHHLKRSLGFIVATMLVLLKIGVFSSYATLTFSLNNCIIPVLGIIFGSSSLFLYFVLKTAVYLFRASSWYGFISLCSLPSFGAGVYLTNLDQYTMKSSKKLLFSSLILICIALFISHTYTSWAFIYSFFWFIPLAALWLPHNNLFIHMLGSTFMAHAIGSNLWLFCGPAMLPAQWLSLIPIVVIERLILASGMFILYHTVKITPVLWFQIRRLFSYSIG